MGRLTKRQFELVNALANREVPITASSLARTLHVSERTVRSDVKVVNTAFENVATIKSYPGKGFLLDVVDDVAFCSCISGRTGSDEGVPDAPNERAIWLIVLLLRRHGYVKIDELCSLMYLDRTTVSRDLRIVRDRLATFGLALDQRQGRGIAVVGPESSQRQCLAEYAYRRSDGGASDLGFDRLAPAVAKILNQDGVIVSGPAMKDLLIDLRVQLERVREGRVIAPAFPEADAMRMEYEYLVAKDVADAVNDICHIVLEGDELLHLSVNILAKQSNVTSAIESCVEGRLRDDVDMLVSDALDCIKMHFGISFNDDAYLRKAIGIHLNQAVARLKHRVFLRNELKENVKKRFLAAFLMGYVAWDAIRGSQCCYGDEDEASYLAIHFQYAMERGGRRQGSKSAVLLNDYGAATSELITMKLSEHFRGRLNIERVISFSELDEIDVCEYDYLLTTTEISTKQPCAVLTLDPLDHELNERKLSRYLESENDRRLTDYARSNDIQFASHLGETWRSAHAGVILYEQESVALRFNFINGESGLKITLLSHADYVRGVSVQLAIELHLGNDWKYLTDLVCALLCDDEALRRMIECKDLESFKDLLAKM